MHAKSTNTTLLILTILLCLVVIGLGAYTFSFYAEVKKNETELLKDKELIQSELKEEINRYNTLLEENTNLSSQLGDAREKLESLQAAIDSNKITRSVVRQYQMQLSQLRKERELLLIQNDRLQQETQRLSSLQKQTQNTLDSLTNVQRKASEQIQSKKQPESKKPLIMNLTAHGVIQRNSGKFVNTTRANRAKMIRVCYTILKNDTSTQEPATIFVQVKYDNEKVIGVQRDFKLSSGDKVKFNTKTTIKFQNESHNVCELIIPIQKFNKGNYTISLFDQSERVAFTELTLK